MTGCPHLIETPKGKEPGGVVSSCVLHTADSNGNGN